jgi:hypothetical protein
MARCSNKQVAKKIVASGRVVEGRAKEDVEINRKIALVTYQ